MSCLYGDGGQGRKEDDPGFEIAAEFGTAGEKHSSVSEIFCNSLYDSTQAVIFSIELAIFKREQITCFGIENEKQTVEENKRVIIDILECSWIIR